MPEKIQSNSTNASGRTWWPHCGIFGETGTGKSYLATQYLYQRPRAVVFDPLWQYNTGEAGGNQLRGFVSIHQPADLAKYLRSRVNSSFRILYQPEYFPDQHIQHVCRLVRETRSCTLAIDEVQEVCKGAGWMPEELAFLARCGRHRGVSLLFTSQRPAYVARGLTSLSRELKVFRLHDRADLAYFRDIMPPDVLRKLPLLQNRTYLARNSQFQWIVYSS